MTRRYRFRRRNYGRSKYRRNTKLNTRLPTKKTIYRRRTSLSQARQIASLNTAVSKLTRTQLQWSQFSLGYTYVHDPTQAANPYVDWMPLNFPTWTPIFQSISTTGDQELKMRLPTITLSGMIRPTTQPVMKSPISGCIFIVSVKSKVSRQFTVDTSQGSTLVQGEHYIANSLPSTFTEYRDSMWLLNKSIFNIHYCKRFNIGQAAAPSIQNPTTGDLTNPVTNIKDNVFRFYHKVKWNKTYRSDMNTSGSNKGWKGLNPNSMNPQDKLYIYVFLNNGAVSGISQGNVAVAINALFKCQTNQE